MIPFDGQFAQNYVYPFAFGAYNAETPPPGYTKDTDAFEILADLSPAFQARLSSMDPRHRKPYDAMLAHPRRPRITDATQATTAAVNAMPRSPLPNQHFGWICLDSAKNRLIVSFRGSEYFRDWLDNFDFAPAPYSPIPGRGTVHQGFLIVYEAVRESVRATLSKLIQSKAGLKEILITGHSLGGALCALSAPDLLDDLAANLAPIVYTWAEPRVGIPITSISSTPASTSATASSIYGTSSPISRPSSPSTNTKAHPSTSTAASPSMSYTTTSWSPATPPASLPGTTITRRLPRLPSLARPPDHQGSGSTANLGCAAVYAASLPSNL